MRILQKCLGNLNPPFSGPISQSGHTYPSAYPPIRLYLEAPPIVFECSFQKDARSLLLSARA